MKTKKIDPDKQPVSRHCMKKLAEIVGPLVVIMIVAQITTTFFIVKYLPENTGNIPASLITELDEINDHIESLGEAQEANARAEERAESETEEEVATPAKTYTPAATTTPEPEAEPETAQDPIVEEPIVEVTAKDTGDHADTNSSSGLVRVHDALCPSGYAMMNARLEKTCE